MSQYPLRLPNQLRQEAEQLAGRQGISLETMAEDWIRQIRWLNPWKKL